MGRAAPPAAAQRGGGGCGGRAVRVLPRALHAAVRLELSRGAAPDLAAAAAAVPGVAASTLAAIASLEATRRLRQGMWRHRQEGERAGYAARYEAGEGALELARSVGLPPCVLLRLLLDEVAGLRKDEVTAVLRAATRGARLEGVAKGAKLAGRPAAEAEAVAARLAEDAARCTAADGVSAPACDRLRRLAGLSHEARLYAALRAAGVPFATEEQLRAKGYARTPDAFLEVPILVDGRVINWIDSKACFGDEHVHTVQCQPQFQAYLNRFGAGMVIYWFGFVRELAETLDARTQVHLVDGFPDPSRIVKLV